MLTELITFEGCRWKDFEVRINPRYTHPGYIGLEKTPANSTVNCPGTYKYRDPYYKELKLNKKYDLESDKNNPLSKNNWLFEYE